MASLPRALKDIVEEFKSKHKNITPALEYAARIIERYIDRNFAEGGRWNGSSVNLFSGGSQKWKPLASSTKQRYKKLGYELVATLNRNGALRSTIGTQVYGKSGIIITANSPYAQIHQEGGTIKHPGGTPYINLGNGLKRFISNKKAKKIESKNSISVQRTKPHTITIPARPYITLTPEDMEELIQYLSEFIIN